MSIKAKERPILFNATMVIAILNGSKTQSRRVIRKQPVPNHRGEFRFSSYTDDEGIGAYWTNNGFWSARCPYGKPGDRLWVRETWSKAESSISSELFYRADGESNGKQYPLSYVERESKWRPSIHMPRWASRMLLEVTNVRVERLNDISEEDAIAEGCISTAIVNDAGDDYTGEHAAEAFRTLWESINGKGSWDLNPFVWKTEFKVISDASNNYVNQ